MARRESGSTLVRFYQLPPGPVERALMGLLGRIYAKNLKACLVAASPEQAARLDESLWTQSVDSFLPHGPCTGPDVALHPILICTEPRDTNGATVLVLAHGRFVDTYADFDMVLDFVIDQSPEGLQISRGRYRRYRDAGCRMEYWVHVRESGWQLKAQETKDRSPQSLQA
ncbi:MAG: DNA polymerase III, chi subunit [Magnetococcales bacterium]|nr:DNA polymerase III, chi subunit [Magnetococcales bacterium]HIJ84594.1 DNA polymerase III subunit chi [Magnetococcales bacterium]